MALNLCFVNKGKISQNPIKIKSNLEDVFNPRNEENGSSCESNNDLDDLIVYNSKGDPHLDAKEVETESEDDKFMPNDNIIISSTSTGLPTLDIYVYNKKSEDFYLHHQAFLFESTISAMDWVDFDPTEPSSKSNVAAVATTEGKIQLWDLDIINSGEPFLEFGQNTKSPSTKIKYHTDVITSIKWSPISRNLIASGAMDKNIILWDLAQTGKRVRSFQPKKGIIRGLSWHISDKEPLLVLCEKKYVFLYDCRYKNSCIQYKLKNRAESICWDLHNNFTFFVGGENGEISHFDMRNSEPVFSWKAHEEAICELSSIFGIKNCLVTCSEDNSIKAWNISQQPTNYIYKKKLKDHAVSMASCMDEPGVFACGMMDDTVKVFDLLEVSQIKENFEIN